MTVILKYIKNLIKNVLYREQPFPVLPFGKHPYASRQTYLDIFNKAREETYPEIDELEQRQGFSIDKQWLDDLALHTQIVIKKSQLNYQHGRLLYTILRNYLSKRLQKNTGGEAISILETGTARGFSSLCMAKALIDSQAPGTIVTLDFLPHNSPIIWNCIDDHDRPKTRQELLSPWPKELDRILFIQGWTKSQLTRTRTSHTHFAFLDAQHTIDDVLYEYAFVRERQQPGDIILFDDVTPGLFDGVVQAVDDIESEGLYSIERIQVSGQRGYAFGQRTN